jgi:hypothetical protein
MLSPLNQQRLLRAMRTFNLRNVSEKDGVRTTKVKPMPTIDKNKALDQINYVLQRYSEYRRPLLVWTDDSQMRAAYSEVHALFDAAFHRLCPPNSPYSSRFQAADDLSQMCGVLEALKSAYLYDWLQSFTELIHQELLSDFLGLAEQLLSESLKDPAAMYAGGVLEEHLRKLATKCGIDLTYKDSKGNDHPKMIDRLNNDLKDKAYSPIQHKQIIAWAVIRNSAAHGKYEEYDAQEIRLMVEGIRLFVSSYPA